MVRHRDHRRHGAAIIAGSLLGFDMSAMRTAIGVAIAQAAGFRATHGSLSTPLMPAQVAQTGLRVTLLAQAGFSSSPVTLEGRYRYPSVFSEQPDLDALAVGPRVRFKILRNIYNPYPCGIVIHPIIHTCLELRTAHDLDPSRIASVAIAPSAGAMALCDNRREAVLQAFTDVDTALIAWRFATEQEKLKRTAVETAQRTATIARAQMAAGTVDITTVLTVETTLFSDEDTLVQVRLARVQALLNLYKASGWGGGWDPVGR